MGGNKGAYHLFRSHADSLNREFPTPHVIASSSGHPSSQSGSTNSIIGTHFRVGKKIGEGSFGVVFDGMLPPYISFSLRRP